MSNTTCPTCGKDGFALQRAMFSHHKQVHGESISSQSDYWVEQPCSNCNEVFEKRRERIDEDDNHFCSESCYGDWQSDNCTGEDGRNWRGGHEYNYGSNWEDQRELCIQRDFSRCRVCRMSREEHREMYGRDILVHHKTPLRRFDTAEDANSLYNLITVCVGCHMSLEPDVQMGDTESSS